MSRSGIGIGIGANQTGLEHNIRAEDLFLDKPFHVIQNYSKLVYRI
jgi:hypothetical protein